jgi:hypothetical protein
VIEASRMAPQPLVGMTQLRCVQLKVSQQCSYQAASTLQRNIATGDPSVSIFPTACLGFYSYQCLYTLLYIWCIYLAGEISSLARWSISSSDLYYTKYHVCHATHHTTRSCLTPTSVLGDFTTRIYILNDAWGPIHPTCLYHLLEILLFPQNAVLAS